jgi:hypothetical protein
MNITVTPWMRYAGVALGGLVGGFFICKYTLPPRTVTKTEMKIVEKIVYQDRIVKEQGPVRTVTRTTTVPGPAGPTVTVEKIVEKEKVVTVTVKEGSSTTAADSKSSVTVDNRPWVALEASLGLGAEARIAYTAGAQMRVLGPLWLGAGVIKADTWYVGPSARVEF